MLRIAIKISEKAGLLLLLCLFTACSSSKYLTGEQRVLSSVSVVSETKQIKSSTYRRYVRQEPNARWFNVVKVPLGIYCMSGKDSTKWLNRFIRKVGEPPVIYDSLQSQLSCKLIGQALSNKGFLHAKVGYKAEVYRKKVKLRYTMSPGPCYTVSSIDIQTDNPVIDSLVRADTTAFGLRVGMPCDVSLLEAERQRIVTMLQNKGYYKINKEFISFRADSVAGRTDLSLQMIVRNPTRGTDSLKVYNRYRFGHIAVLSDVSQDGMRDADSLKYKGVNFYYRGGLRVLPSRLYEQIGISSGSYYSDQAIQSTYRNMNRMPIMKYSVVHMNEVQRRGENVLDCKIITASNDINAIETELEGTNTAGDMGVAASLTYTNRNLFKGSELFSIKLRGAYEAITGLEGYGDENYLELSAEASIRFPRFLFPSASLFQNRSSLASTEVSLMYDSQNRPEFYRRVLTAAWRYHWTGHKGRLQHRLDLLSLNYVFMPWISDTFRKNYLDSVDSRNSILRYSYENLLIMRVGYNFAYNSSHVNAVSGIYQANAYQVRLNVETAGNVLYAASNLFGGPRDGSGQYTLFGIAYAQYAKLDFDYARSFLIDERNSVAFRVGLGIVAPYGNAKVVPYEKRYFSGGANSVRGWSVRELGPGSFTGEDGTIDFINQMGDMKLDLSLEYRTYLFWKLHGAVFVDAGNVWTLKNYPEQPGGQFHFDEFYKQIAVSYGMGIRLNFDYFILRFDGGMKAVNPAWTDHRRHYPLLYPEFKRDFTFHFAVGLPF